MCRWTNKLPLSVQRTLLVAVFYLILAESARNELKSVTNIQGDACPGDVLMYICSITGGGNTIWNGTAFYCPSKSNETILRHSQFKTESGTSGSCNDRAIIMAQSLGVTNNCYSSQLNITVTSDMNNKTIQCSHSSNSILTVGVVTLSIAPVPYPPPSVRLAEVRAGELIFSWVESDNSPAGLYYTINSTCGNCPNETTATTVTCAVLNLSTTPTMCMFGVRSVACGTIGSPSLPIAVTLRVPDAPDAVIIPQYPSNGQSLTAVVVRVEHNVNSFPISGDIFGSTTSYHILSSGRSVQHKPACMEDTCEYTFDLPPPNCSTSSIDIAVASANTLGLGAPSESTTIECNNDFVKVEYNPSTRTISCTFENELDSTQKSCRVNYGVCDQEPYMHFAQDNTTTGSPSTITLTLSKIAVNSRTCYVVTASNGSHTVMVKGSFESQSSSRLSVIVGPVIGVVVAAVIVIVIVIVIVVRIRRNRRREYALANQRLIDTQYVTKELKYDLVEMSEVKGDKDSSSEVVAVADQDQINEKAESITDSEDFVMVDESPTKIRSTQFKVATVQKDCKLDDLKPKHGQIIFVDIEHHSSEKIIDVMLMDKDGQLFSGRVARDLIVSKGKRSEWDKVFILPLAHEEVSLVKDECILHQDHDQLKKRMQLRVLHVDKDSKLSRFLQDKLNQKSPCFDNDYARAYYEFPNAKMDLLYYREVIEVSNSKLKETSAGKDYIILEASTGRGIRTFYDLKPRAPGEGIKPPSIKNVRSFVQSTSQDSDRCLKAGSLVLYEEDIGIESHR